MRPTASDLGQLVVIAEVTHSFTISHNRFSPTLPNTYKTLLKFLGSGHIQVDKLWGLCGSAASLFGGLQATTDERQYYKHTN